MAMAGLLAPLTWASLWCYAAADSLERPQPSALWATLVHNSSAKAAPTYASMAGNDPASGKDWKSKPKQQVKAWNNSMQNTYHTYIPDSYQTFPAKVADIRASSASSDKEQSSQDYSDTYGNLGNMAVQKANEQRREHSREGSHAGGPAVATRDHAAHQPLPDAPKQRDRPGEGDYAKYLNSYGNNEPSNAYLPDLDKIREEHFGPPPSSRDSAVSQSQHSLSFGPHAGPDSLGEDTSSSTDDKWSPGTHVHQTGWKQQLSGVIPPFAPGYFVSAQPLPGATGASPARATKFLAPAPATQSNGPEEEDFKSEWTMPVVCFAALALAVFVKGSISPRSITPPQQLLG